MDNITNKRKYPEQLKDKLNCVGFNIREFRLNKGWSRKKLSDQLLFLGIDISTQAIYDIEIGKRTILDYELFGIAKVLEISVDKLFIDFDFKTDEA